MSTLFEIGKDYLVTLVGNAPQDHYKEDEAIWRVAEFVFPIARFCRADRNDWIVNVTSSHFVSAQIANRHDNDGNEITSLPGH